MRLDHLLSKELNFLVGHAMYECYVGGLLMGGMLGVIGFLVLFLGRVCCWVLRQWAVGFVVSVVPGMG